MIVIWYLFLQLISFSTWGLLSKALPSFPDRGLGFSKYIGLCLLTIISFLGCVYGHLSFSRESLSLLVILYCLVGLYFTIKNKELLKTVLKSSGKYTEAVYLISFFFFLMLRAYQPEIFWGEKPMDGTFLNFFVRTETLPPTDPWASNSPLLYYYFGYILYAIPHKLFGLDTSIGYNVAIATIGATHCTVIFSLLLRLIKNILFSVIGAVIISSGANADTLYHSIFEKKNLNFDFFWATSRTLTSPAFNEYPIWGFMFGDLHAHLITLPITVIILGLGIEIVSTGLISTTILAAILTASLIGFNAWDIIPLGVTGIILCLFGGNFTAKRFLQGGIFLGIFAGLYFLIHGYVAPDNGLHIGWVFPEEFNQISFILRHFGIFIVSLLLLIIPILLSSKFGMVTLKTLIIFCLIAPIFQFSKSPSLAPYILYPFLALSSLFLALSMEKRRKFEVKILLLLSSIGLLLIPVIEHVFFMDRMNTTFKFNHMVWTLLGIGSVGLLKNLFDASQEKIVGTFLSGLCRSILILPIAASFAGTVILMMSLLPFQRIQGPRPTLDGRAYLTAFDGDEARMISWLNKEVPGTPVIVEAVGNSYGEYTRVSMHTGLPVILGWGYHVTQRGTSRDESDKRKDDVEKIYKSNDNELVNHLLKKYQTKFVVVGNLEKRVYGEEAFHKFINNPVQYKIAFQSGSATIFEVL